MTKYIFRIDDVHPKMNWELFEQYISLFEEAKVKVLLGIIPQNKDLSLDKAAERIGFWEYIHQLKEKGVIDISMHGFEHIYSTKNGGILKSYGIKNQSEFAGLSYDQQYEKIKAGKAIFLKHEITTNVFMPPGHTFDLNTIKALKNNGFDVITDGIGILPYRKDGVLLVPQQIAVPRRFPFGVITICIHINMKNDEYYKKVAQFLRQNRKYCISISDVVFKDKTLSKIMNAISMLLFYLMYKVKRR